MSTSLPDRPFTYALAKTWGWSRGQLRTAVRTRRVVRVLHGVYLRGDVVPSTRTKLQAAALVVGPHAVVCDRTAAWIWGVPCHDHRELDSVPPVETYVLRGHPPSERPEVAGGTRDLMPCDWVEVEGVRVTTPIRTAMDLGCSMVRRRALATMDGLMREHGFSVDDLRRLLPRYFRRRGVIQLRELVPLVDGRAESPRESWTRLEIIDHGLPAPELQWWIHVDGVPTYRLDLAYPHARIAVEYDGAEFHSSLADRERDLARRTWLREHGWTVIVLDRHSFAPDAVDAWVSELRDALATAQAKPQRWFAR
jgi:hypothetical protein